MSGHGDGRYHIISPGVAAGKAAVVCSTDHMQAAGGMRESRFHKVTIQHRACGILVVLGGLAYVPANDAAQNGGSVAGARNLPRSSGPPHPRSTASRRSEALAP